MAFKMKGMHHGVGTGSFKKTSAFKEVPGGGPSVADRIREKREQRAGKTETKTHKLFGREWKKTKQYDDEGKKIGKRTKVYDRYGEQIGDSGGRGTLKEGYVPPTGDNKNKKVKKPQSGSFDEAFATHRKKMVETHGDNYEKWTNFIWGDDAKQFHPYTKDDISKGADAKKSVPLTKKGAFKNYKKGYYGIK